MGADSAGIDLAAYGLRIRPVDMQKFGMLYLANGQWQGRQLLPAAWIDKSFTAYEPATPALPAFNDYGWFFWDFYYGHSLLSHQAIGWRGQYIAIAPADQLVVTMTADIEDGSESAVFAKIMESYVMPALANGHVGATPSPGLEAKISALLSEVYSGPSRISPNAEARMVPSIAPKETTAVTFVP